MLAYKSFISSVLSYIWQLEPNPDNLLDDFEKALRKMMPGPGSWVSRGDLCNLKAYGFPIEFPDPRWTAMAAKLRVVHQIASDCEQKHKDIQILPLEMGRRPFPSWHRRCYFSVLAEALSLCRDRGITLKRIAATEASCDRARSFQNIAEEAISSKFRDPYFRESRIRAHGVFWKFSVLPGHLETRVLSRFRILAERAPLKVWFVYFRTMWNGWVTYDRMKQLLPPRPCLLGCGYDEDRVDHYCCCNVYWSFLRRPRPQGLGIQSERGKDTALLLNKSLSDEDVLRLAIGLYAVYRTVNAVRFSEPHEAPSDFHRLLRMFAKQAVNASNGRQLLLP